MLHHTTRRMETALLLAVSLGGAPLTGLCQSPAEIANNTEASASVRLPTPFAGLSASLPATLPASQQSIASVANRDQITPEDEADALLGRQRYQEAISAYERVPKKNAAVWNKMGVAYQLMLDTDDAERCYKIAHHLEPKNATAINNLGSIEMAKKKYGRAEKLYRKAIKLSPRSALFAKNLGTAYLTDKRYKKGWEAYRLALSIDPNVFSHTAGVRIENPSSVEERGALNYYMAKGCVLAGKPHQAIEYLRLALNEGFVTPKKLIEDNEFATLRTFPEFQQLIEANLEHH